MSGYQAGSRWEVTLAVRRALTANLQAHADAESDRLAAVYGELSGDDYTGDGVLLRIPDIVSVQTKMDTQATTHPTACPAVFVGGLGTSTIMDAEMTGRQAFGDTTLEIAAYVTTRAVYQGAVYRLTEEELILMAGSLGGALINALRAGGANSVWSAQAGIINPQVESLTINGYQTGDDEKTSAAKVLLTARIGHEMRY